jgi:PAS domain-containing protein
MTAAVPLADLFTAEDWFTLLDVSLTGIHLARPVYASNGTELVDFVIEYVNPAGQRMTGLPEQPGDTLLNRFPMRPRPVSFTTTGACLRRAQRLPIRRRTGARPAAGRRAASPVADRRAALGPRAPSLL